MPYEKNITDLVKNNCFRAKMRQKGETKTALTAKPGGFFEMVLNFMPTRVQVITFVEKKLWLMPFRKNNFALFQKLLFLEQNWAN